MKAAGALTIDQAQQLILRAMTSSGWKTIPLARAFGRVTARDVVAPGDQPRFNSAAMDGWVMRGQAAMYDVVGESRAGVAYDGVIGDGQAVAISTGAMVPQGATALIRREQGYEAGGQLTIAVYTR